MFFALATLGLVAMASCEKEAEKTPEAAPELTNETQITGIPFTGGEFTYEFDSNKKWTVAGDAEVTIEGQTYEFGMTPTSGDAGHGVVTVTVPANKGAKEISYSFTLTLLGEDKDTEPLTKTVSLTIPAPSVTDAAGNTYKVVYLKDGNYWMAENLRYIPEGAKVSDGTEEGCEIWYPYSTDGKTTTALKDEASVKKLGLLYTAAVALGVKAIDENNYNKLEGVQGICPKGWHIPTRSELVGLCAETTKGDGEDAKPAIKTDAVFYDATLQKATITKANEAGFNFTFSGFVNNGKYNALAIDNTVCDKEAYFGNPRMSYYLASTGFKAKSAFQTFSMFSTFTKENMFGKLSAGYNNLPNGVAVRCVMDKTAK